MSAFTDCEATAEALIALAKAKHATEVIVMIGCPDGEHSAYAFRYEGACLPVLGLLDVASRSIRDKISFPSK